MGLVFRSDAGLILHGMYFSLVVGSETRLALAVPPFIVVCSTIDLVGHSAPPADDQERQ